MLSRPAPSDVQQVAALLLGQVDSSGRSTATGQRLWLHAPSFYSLLLRSCLELENFSLRFRNKLCRQPPVATLDGGRYIPAVRADTQQARAQTTSHRPHWRGSLPDRPATHGRFVASTWLSAADTLVRPSRPVRQLAAELVGRGTRLPVIDAQGVFEVRLPLRS